MQTTETTADGELKPAYAAFAESPKDETGRADLALTTSDYTAVLADIIPDTPKLLTPETITAMFAPQFLSRSAALKALVDSKMIYSGTTGGVLLGDSVN